MKKLLNAGDLRHRIAIQELVEDQDSETGDIVESWVTVNDERGDWSSVPASIVDMSAREFIAAAAVQAETMTRFVIRYRAGIEPKMRLSWRGRVYNIRGVLKDMDSALEYLTLVCSEGPNQG